MTELPTLPVMEPAEIVPAPEVTLPVSRLVTDTSPPERLPVSVPAETVPPVTLAVRRPVTLMMPAATPPVIVALAPKVVLPAPARETTVIVPEPVKFKALSSVAFALLSAPTVSPLPVIVALAVTSRVSVAAELKLAAERMAPLTVMLVVLARAPAAAVRVPAETVVAPV